MDSRYADIATALEFADGGFESREVYETLAIAPPRLRPDRPLSIKVVVRHVSKF
jgi:hypothetical protein